MMHASHKGEPCSMCGACACHEPDKATNACQPIGYLPVAQYLNPNEGEPS